MSRHVVDNITGTAKGRQGHVRKPVYEVVMSGTRQISADRQWCKTLEP